MTTDEELNIALAIIGKLPIPFIQYAPSAVALGRLIWKLAHDAKGVPAPDVTDEELIARMQQPADHIVTAAQSWFVEHGLPIPDFGGGGL